MNKKSIRFASAVNYASRFEPEHFGNADKYLIYEWSDNELIFINEETNSFKSFDDVQQGGLSNKSMACINLLDKDGIIRLVKKKVKIINKKSLLMISANC